MKALLKETFEWPTKYGRLFAKCPLKLRKGILLYGPPGCGKTLIGMVAWHISCYARGDVRVCLCLCLYTCLYVLVCACVGVCECKIEREGEG